MSEPIRSVDELVATLRGLAGVDSEGGGFTELEHALQCAALLEAEVRDDVELQLAGLVHDIGHLTGDDAHHGEAGGRAVGPLLGPRVAALVEAHVPAKRYLVAHDPDYRNALSPVSVGSLQLQGGAMDAELTARWERDAVWADALRLRRADDRAKLAGKITPPLDHWIPKLEEAAKR